MRACTRCGEVKPLDAFPPVRRGEHRLQTWCRDCFAAYGVEYYRRNREAQKARLLRNASIRRADNRTRSIDYLRTHPCVDCGEMDIIVLQFDHLRDKKANVTDLINSGATWAAIEREIAKCEVRCANCHRLETARRYAAANGRSSAKHLGKVLPEQLHLADATLRICRVCKVEQPLSAFPFRSKSQRVRQWICLACQREVSRAWYLRQSPNARRVGGYGRKMREKLAAQIDGYLEDHPCVDCGESNLIVLDFDHLRDKTDDVANMVAAARPWSEIKGEIAKCEVCCANCHARRTARRIGAYKMFLATVTPERIELSPSVS
jgi:hypothetical protein